MIGMPLLPDTRILDTGGDVTIYDPSVNTSTTIPTNTEYRHISLGKKSDHYTAYFPYPNGFYSARLRSLSDNRFVRAGVTLFAPQASLDRSSPVINLPTNVRVPVYQSTTFSKDEMITDMSSYTLTVDPDVTQDTDKNGIYEDDFVSSGSGVSIDTVNMVFGPYDTLGTRMVNLRAIDAYGNITLAPTEIEVYAPMPSIDTYSAT